MHFEPGIQVGANELVCNGVRDFRRHCRIRVFIAHLYELTLPNRVDEDISLHLFLGNRNDLILVDQFCRRTRSQYIFRGTALRAAASPSPRNRSSSGLGSACRGSNGGVFVQLQAGHHPAGDVARADKRCLCLNIFPI